MAVVPDFEKYKRFNVTQIVQEKLKQNPDTDTSSRVAALENLA